MICTKKYFILQVFLVVHLLYTSYALQCKTCEKNDPTCLLGHEVAIRDCGDDNDFCYSWFDRTKSQVGVQRGCISPDMAEYKMIKDMIDDRDSDCVKRVNGLDCFKFCSTDNCN